MAVDDHAIDSLKTWFDLEYEELKKEWKSGKYEKFTECPSFESTAAYRKALNILVEARYLPEYVDDHKIKPLRKTINEELHLENFWKQNSK